MRIILLVFQDSSASKMQFEIFFHLFQIRIPQNRKIDGYENEFLSQNSSNNDFKKDRFVSA